MKKQFSRQEIQENRINAALGYLPVVFFLPLVLCPQSKYGRFCANQGLIITLAFLALSVAHWIVSLVFGWIWVIGSLIGLAFWLARIGLLGLSIVYFLKAYNGRPEALPYVGFIDLIK